MSFIGSEFVIFTAGFFAALFLAPHAARRPLLLAGSWLFCARFGLDALIVLLVSTAANYGFCRLIESGRAPVLHTRLAIAFNIAWLASFKYVGFLVNDVLGLDGLFASDLKGLLGVLIPIGVSFYTFQAIMLVMDVRRGAMRAPTLFETALFLAFWPKLVAGPIERAPRFLGQLDKALVFRWANLWLALELVVYGIALKTLLGDYLAPEVNRVFKSPLSYSGIDNLFAVLLYTFQIYGDFAGYSLIAIGMARLMGIKIGPNFRRPNFARSFTDFWSRWHMSLSRFLTTYVYRQLPYSKSEPVIARNQVVTMLVSGIWHGPAWTFIAWGGLHGLYLVAQRQITRLVRWLPAPVRGLDWTLVPLQIAMVFAAVAFSRIFFRADSIDQAFQIIGHIASSPLRLEELQNKSVLALCLMIIAAVTFVEMLIETGVAKRLKRQRAVRIIAALTTAIVCLVFGEFEGGQFVYVRF